MVKPPFVPFTPFRGKILIPPDKSLTFDPFCGIIPPQLRTRTKQHRKQGELQIMANNTRILPIHWETQPRTVARPTTNRQQPKAVFTKRTQFTVPPPGSRPKNAKRTQLTPPRVIPSVGLRSEAQRPKVEGSAQSPSPEAIPHKQTIPIPQKHETNPISNKQYTFYNLQYTIPWPNPSKISHKLLRHKHLVGRE